MTRNEVSNVSKSEGGMFAVIPSVVMKDKDLPMSAKMLYGIITWKCNDLAYCWATNRTLGAELDLSPKRVSALLSLLEQQGHIETDIERDRVSGQILKRYIFPIVKSSRGVFEVLHKGGPIPKNEDTYPHNEGHLSSDEGRGIPKNEEYIGKENIKENNSDVLHEAIESIRPLLVADDANAAQDAVLLALAQNGFSCQHKAPINTRGKDKRYTGRISILAAKDGKTIGIEVDRKKPRDKSVYKLLHFDCDYRLLILRNSSEQEPPPGIDAVVSLALADAPDLFEAFWRAYPKKINKQKAHEAFAKLHISPEMLQTMLYAIEQQKKSRQWKESNGQYIPYASTWLNGHRWEDETESPPPLRPDRGGLPDRDAPPCRVVEDEEVEWR